MANTEVGSAYVSLYPKMGNGFNRQVAGAAALGGAFGSVVSKAFDAISGSMDKAISRLDTMENFPRVMKNMGYSTEESKAAISRLSDAIQGMPTGLDTVVATTQQLAPLAGGLERATDLTIALNNAFLASGSSAADASRGMLQYTQMLAKGKVDMQSWRTLQETMPMQLNQIAEAMLGVGKNSNDLYESLQSGAVSFDDFNNAIIRLNSEGTGQFASFTEQAKTGVNGIGTAISNVGNRIALSVSKVMEHIGRDKIAAAINGVTSQFPKIADDFCRVVDVIMLAWQQLEPAVMPVVNAIKGALESLHSVFQNMSQEDKQHLADIAVKALGAYVAFKAFSSTASGISTVITTISGLKATIPTMAGMAMELFNFVRGATMGPPAILQMGGAFTTLITSISPITLAIAAAVAAFVFFYTTCEPFRDFINGIASAVADFFAGIPGMISTAMGAVGGFIEAVMGGFISLGSSLESGWNTLTAFLGNAFTIATNRITAAWQGFQSAFIAVAGVLQGVWQAFSTVLHTVFNAAANVVKAAITAVQAAFTSTSSHVTAVWNAFGNTMKNIGQSIGSFFTNTVPNAIGNAFQKARDWALRPIRDLQSRVQSTVQRIQSYFTGARLRFPHIPLPHPRISGSFSLNPPRVPHFAIDWYAKGGVFDQPSVIGVGEAGREAVLPIDHIKPYFQEAAKDMPRNGTDDEAIIKWLDRNLGRIIYEYAPTATPREFARLINA